MAIQWTLDPTHSEIEFKVKHLMISTVTGKFTSFQAQAETEGEDFNGAKVSFQADVASINTGVEQRDGHLKGEDFFHAEQYPQITFANGVLKNEGGEWSLNGDLTMRGVTRPVVLAAEFNGTMVDPYGNHKAGFEVSGKINRKDFHLNWSFTTEAGGIVVSDEVKLICNVQMVKVA